MTKADIVEKISKLTGLSKKEAADSTESVFSIIKQTLESGASLKISGFGSFVVREKAERKGRNPKTGEAMILNSRRVLSFKPSNVLRDALNR